MANWDILKEAISSTIKTNGNQEITGQLLQNVLLNIVSNFGENISYRGVATPATNPGAPDGPVFYFAFEPGRYANFGGISVADQPLILTWNNGSWASEPMDFASIESVNEITKSVNEINRSVNEIISSVNEITRRIARIKGTISTSDSLDSKKEISDIGLWFVNRTQDPGIVLVCRDFENHYVQVKLSATRNVSINETTNKPSIQYRKYIDNAWTEWTEIEFNILKAHILQVDGIAIQGTPLGDYIKAIVKAELAGKV